MKNRTRRKARRMEVIATVTHGCKRLSIGDRPDNTEVELHLVGLDGTLRERFPLQSPRPKAVVVGEMVTCLFDRVGNITGALGRAESSAMASRRLFQNIPKARQRFEARLAKIRGLIALNDHNRIKWHWQEEVCVDV